MALPSVGGPHRISRGPEQNKRANPLPSKKDFFCLSLNWDVVFFPSLQSKTETSPFLDLEPASFWIGTIPLALLVSGLQTQARSKPLVLEILGLSCLHNCVGPILYNKYIFTHTRMHTHTHTHTRTHTLLTESLSLEDPNLLPKATYRFNAIPIKIPVAFLLQKWKIWFSNSHGIAKKKKKRSPMSQTSI